MPQEDSGNRVLLNQPFYAAAPHGYLMQRVTALLAFREKGDAVKDLLDPEFKVGEVPFKVQNEAPEAEADVRDRFVIAESQVLIHQAAETLLRLYFAHVDLPGEPWVVLARERDFRKFRGKVNELQERLASGEEDDRLHLVFHSSPNRADLSPEPAKELWDAALENIRSYMKRLSRVFLDSDPYNAAKHGLIVPAGRSAVEVSVDDRAFMEKSGPTIDFLSLRPQDDHREWKKVTRWFNPDHLIGITIASCHFIHLMWLVGRRRYLGEEVELHWLFDRPTLAEIEGEDGPDFQEIAFGWGLVES